MKRRTFLKILSMMATSMSLNQIEISKGLATTPSNITNKKLVVLELLGGNDGLNTVIPYTDETYYKARPNIAVSKEQAIPISNDFALHPELELLFPYWEAGNIAIVLGIGYPNQDLSHFRSTDIWRGASTETIIKTGWLGRYLSLIYPDYPQTFSNTPPGLEIKNRDTLLLMGEHGQMAIAIKDPDSFYQMVKSKIELPESPINNLYSGDELSFVKKIKNAAINYSSCLYEKSSTVNNSIEYPENQLSKDFALIARLIAAGLETPVYSVSLNGFDTHSNQLQSHPQLLKTIAETINAFLIDLIRR